MNTVDWYMLSSRYNSFVMFAGHENSTCSIAMTSGFECRTCGRVEIWALFSILISFSFENTL